MSLRYGLVPVNNLIIVDGFSTDNTRNIAEGFAARYGYKLKFIQEKCGLGDARLIGLSHIETLYFLSIDSDIQLSFGYYPELLKELDKDPGLTYASGYLVFGSDNVVYDYFNYYRLNRIPSIVISCALFRTDKADFRFMAGLHFGEDKAYNYSLLRDGGRYIIRYDLIANHPSSVKRDLGHAVLWGKGGRAVGVNWLLATARIPRAFILGFASAYKMRNLHLIYYFPLHELLNFYGYVTGKPHLKMNSFFRELKILAANRRIVGAKGF